MLSETAQVALDTSLALRAKGSRATIEERADLLMVITELRGLLVRKIGESDALRKERASLQRELYRQQGYSEALREMQRSLQNETWTPPPQPPVAD